jgi:hypothetical protein
MNLQAIKIAFIAGLEASEIFASVKPAELDAVVIADRHREAVDHVDRVGVQLLLGLTQ